MIIFHTVNSNRIGSKKIVAFGRDEQGEEEGSTGFDVKSYLLH
jgi:hypothetical protein